MQFNPGACVQKIDQYTLVNSTVIDRVEPVASP